MAAADVVACTATASDAAGAAAGAGAGAGGGAAASIVLVIASFQLPFHNYLFQVDFTAAGRLPSDCRRILNRSLTLCADVMAHGYDCVNTCEERLLKDEVLLSENSVG